MPRSWWTRKHLVFMLALVSLACVVAFVVAGLAAPEPLQSAALGPQWQCTRPAFGFTICSGVAGPPAGIRNHDLEPGVGARARHRSGTARAGVPAAAGVSGGLPLICST